MPAKLIDHRLAEDRTLHRVMQDVKPDQSRVEVAIYHRNSSSKSDIEIRGYIQPPDKVKASRRDSGVRSQRQPNVNGLPAAGGETLTNNYLQYRNTLYWDKQATEVGPGDVTKAHLYHWLHLQGNINDVTAVIESEKPALENRIWYLYPNQIDGDIFTGDGTEPTIAARVLDDGTTQAWQSTYNSLGHIMSRIDPVGRKTTFAYGPNGIDLMQIANTTGGISDVLAAFTWNTQHRPLTVTDAAGQLTTLTYDAVEQLLTSTNPRNETTTLAYNTGSQLTSITRPIAGATLGFTYDGYGRIRTTTDADAYTVTFDYDALNRLTQRTHPDGRSEQLVYDRLDLAKTRDRLGRWTVATYDADRHLTAVRDPLGRVVQEIWCACGSLASLTDPNGNVTSWTRDAQARVIIATRADHSTTTYTYDTATGRLKTVTDAKGQVTTYSYAVDDAVASVTYTNAAIATPSVSFTYDTTYPRITSMTDGTGTTAYTYTPPATRGAGRVAAVDGPLTDDTITYVYDELGRVASRTLDETTNTWTYDALGRVSAQLDPVGSFGYAYDGATARLQQLGYPNGQKSIFSYFDNAHDRRLQEIHHQRIDGTTLSDFQYAYDLAGNITSWTQQYGADAKTYDFAYDAADQLTSAVFRTTGPTPTVLTRYGYAYDVTGNRTTARTDDTPLAFAYNNLNHIQAQSGGGRVQFSGTTNEAATVTVSGQTAAGGGGTTFTANVLLASGTNTVTVAATDPSGNASTKQYEVDVAANDRSFTYDADGNLIAQGTKTYEWDAVNRLTRVLDDGSEVARFSVRRLRPPDDQDGRGHPDHLRVRRRPDSGGADGGGNDATPGRARHRPPSDASGFVWNRHVLLGRSSWQHCAGDECGWRGDTDAAIRSVRCAAASGEHVRLWVYWTGVGCGNGVDV